MGGELDKDKKRYKITTSKSGRIKDRMRLSYDYNTLNKELKMMELIQVKNPKKIDYDLINNCIEKHYFMKLLKYNERNEIIVNMSLFKVKPHITLYNQGSIGNLWYIVAKGQLDFYVDGNKKKSFFNGDSFGENALMYNCPQDGTVKTVTECELWVLNKDYFTKIKEYLYKTNYKEFMSFIKNIKLPISDTIKIRIPNHLVKNIYKAKDIICKEGDLSNCIYIIKEGEVNILKNGNLIKTIKRSEYFGEDGLLEEGNKRNVDIIAKTNCIIYTISNDYFRDQFNEDYNEQLYYTLLKIAFYKSSNFKSINNNILNKIFKYFNFKSFRKNSIIYRKQIDISKKLCVILYGNIIDKGTNIIIAKTYDILFEDNVVNENEYKIKNDLISEANCIIAETNYEDIKNELGDNICNNISHNIEHNIGYNIEHNIGNNIDNNIDNIDNIGYNINRTINHDISRNIAHNISRNIAHNISRSIDHNISRRIGHNINRSIGHNIHRNIGHNIHRNIGHNINHNISPRIGNIGNNIGINRTIDYNINRNIDNNISNNNIGHNIGYNIGYNIGHKFGHKIGHNIGHKIGHNIGHKFDHNIGHNISHNIGHSYGKINKIDNNIDNIGYNNNRNISHNISRNKAHIILRNFDNNIRNKIAHNVSHNIDNIDNYISDNTNDNINNIDNNIKINKEISHEMKAIEKIKLFKFLNIAQKELIEKNLKIEKFNNGEKILIQGDIGNKLYIIKKGKVDFYLNSKYMKSKFEGDDFGSKSLIVNDRKNLSTIIANGPVECFTLSANVFKNILNPELRQYFLNQYYLNDYSIQLKDCVNLKTLGCGSYGVVNLVRNKKNRQLYAIKAMDLIQIKEENILRRVELEKNLLLKMDHPFIAKIVKYIKGEVYLYYIMEYVRGKELFDVMRDINLLNKKQTQFFSSSILEVINYLHNQKIIYRDLKPENIMVLENGYIKFFDFGTVKEIKNNRTKTFIGTISYMAPEVFTGNGYSFEVDMWSLGIMMYEFICGKLPFGEDIDDPMEFYNTMISQNLIFPTFVNDQTFKDLISNLLIKDPNKRLSQYIKIKNHPYFSDFEWEKLLSLNLPAPYKFKLYGIIENPANPEPYLTYLKSLGKKPYNNLKASIRQRNFKKWLKDF